MIALIDIVSGFFRSIATTPLIGTVTLGELLFYCFLVPLVWSAFVRKR